MSDYVDEIDVDVDVGLDDEETPEEALRVVENRIDELEAALELVQERTGGSGPQGKVMRLELRVLEQVRERLESMI